MGPDVALLGALMTGCGPDFDATELPVTIGLAPEVDFLSPGTLSRGLATGSGLEPGFLVLLPGFTLESPFLVSTRILS